MADFDVVIENGTIVDGTRMPRYRADLGIRSGRVSTIGRLSGRNADRRIDATGLVVAPGFVDLHTHYDAQLFWDPTCSISSWHGVQSAPRRTRTRPHAASLLGVPEEALE